MSYDPRMGGSAYLGMDDDLLDDESLEEDFAEADDRQASSNQRKASRPNPRRATSPSNIPPTTRRPSEAPRRGVAPVTPSIAQRRQPHEPVRAVPAPRPDRYEPAPSPVPDAIRSRAAGPLTSLEVFALRALALLARVAAIVLAALVVASVFLGGAMRESMLQAMRLTPLLVPSALLGRFVYETPFGGVLRGDLALASLILFVVDWTCMRLSDSLRMRGNGRA